MVADLGKERVSGARAARLRLDKPCQVLYMACLLFKEKRMAFLTPTERAWLATVSHLCYRNSFDRRTVKSRIDLQLLAELRTASGERVYQAR